MKLRDKIVAAAITIGVGIAGYFIQREIRPIQVTGDLLLTQTGVYTSSDPNKEWKTLHKDPNARYVNIAINSKGAIILTDYKTGIVRINDPTPSLAIPAHQ